MESVELCMIYRYLYYVLDSPLIGDMNYDALEKEALKYVDEEHPLRKPGSSLKSSYSKEIIDKANELLKNVK